MKIADPYREYAADHPKTISPYRTKRGRKLLQRLSTTASGLSSSFVFSSFCFLFSSLLFFSFVFFFAEASSFVAGALFFASSLEEKFTEASTVFVSFAVVVVASSFCVFNNNNNISRKASQRKYFRRSDDSLSRREKQPVSRDVANYLRVVVNSFETNADVRKKKCLLLKTFNSLLKGY